MGLGLARLLKKSGQKSGAADKLEAAPEVRRARCADYPDGGYLARVDNWQL